MAKMKAPPGATSCSFGGESFEVDQDGLVDVPEEAVSELLGHGYGTYVPGDPSESNDGTGAGQGGPLGKGQENRDD